MSQELIITSGGENIAPVTIEETIKAELSEIVSYAVVIGDNRKHLSVILTLRTEEDNTRHPNSLHPDLVTCLKRHNCKVATLEDLVGENIPILDQIIVSGLERANERAQSRAHKVHKYILATNEFSVATGELTPTMKLKRHFILKKYKDDIERLYA